MQKLKLIGLSILSGILMGLSWPATGNLAPLFFIALVPLLYVEDVISQNLERYKSYFVFINAYITFFTFNVFTLWWIWFASPGGMFMVAIIYTLFMAITFFWFHTAKKRLGTKRGYIALVVFWIGFEWLHSNWELSHPWNTIGHTWSNYPELVQWFDHTGVMGGTLWLFIVNILIFKVLKNIYLSKETAKANIKLISVIAAIIIIPSIYSIITYSNYVEEKNPVEVVVVQPNIDPYNKFGRITEAEQVNTIINLAQQKVTPNTQYIVAPETAIPRGSEETQFEKNYGIVQMRKFIKPYPTLKFLTGISSQIDYGIQTIKPTVTARSYGNPKMWYDAFNTAILIDNSAIIQTYHKSKLVLGAEKMPYPKLLAPLESFAVDLGGTFGSLGAEKEAKIFKSNTVNVAPIICYESVFAGYCSSFVKKGANLIFIITNDGWWKDTPGYKQHLAFARLRAIENRRSIARSANTGTSCFINQRGDIQKATQWWKKTSIINTLNSNNKLTFYSENGDWIGRVSAGLSVLLLLWSWSVKIKTKFK